MSDDFERGVRFVLERVETYSKGTAEPALQFDDYVISMVPVRSADLLKGSSEHREKRVRAMLRLADLERSS